MLTEGNCPSTKTKGGVVLQCMRPAEPSPHVHVAGDEFWFDDEPGGIARVYPVTIIRSRYNGTYEGARWVAFNDDTFAVRDAEGGDIACCDFFADYPKPIGRGDSAQEAYEDLIKKLESE